MALGHLRLTGDPGYDPTKPNMYALRLWVFRARLGGRGMKGHLPGLYSCSLLLPSSILSTSEHCTVNRNQDAPKCLYFGYRAAV